MKSISRYKSVRQAPQALFVFLFNAHCNQIRVTEGYVMDREMQPLCEREPGPMEHVKIERKSTVMYSNTGVKVITCGV